MRKILSMPDGASRLGGAGDGSPRTPSKTRLKLEKLVRGEEALFSGRRSMAKQFSVTVREENGMHATIEDLSSFDRLNALRAKVAHSFDSPEGLTKILFQDKPLTMGDLPKTLGELGICEGAELKCTCKAPAEIDGHIYALTESHVKEDADIASAVRAEFGSKAVVADFSALMKICADVDVDEFVTFLDALGPFVTARVYPNGRKDKKGSYIQREQERYACTDFANIHMRLTLREGAFHPMYVLVDLGEVLMPLAGTRISAGNSIAGAVKTDSLASVDGQASSTASLLLPPPPKERCSSFTMFLGKMGSCCSAVKASKSYR